MNSRSPALFMALCLSTLFPSTAYSAVAAPDTAKKPRKPKKPAKPERAVSDSTWSAMVDRQIIVVSDGREIRGRLAGHDADNVTLIESNGAIAELSKDSVSAVRADMKPEPKQAQEPASTREPEARGQAATSANDGLGPVGSFRRRGKFLLLSPGILALPFSFPIFYRWGLSFGGFIPGTGSRFAGAYGFTFEHFVNRTAETYTDYDLYAGAIDRTVNVWSHMIRALGEFRLGGSNERVFGYALIGFGGAVHHVSVDGGTGNVTDTELGLAMPLGAGIQGLLGKHFVLGVEPRAIFDFMLSSGISAMFDARLVLGARF